MIDSSETRTESPVWGVAALVHAVADQLSSRFGACWVEGELSAVSPAASGHWYFSLKDAQGEAALLRCALFKRAAAGLTQPLRDGQRVAVWGRLAVYEPRGDLQFIVERVRPVGEGDLHAQFLALKARLLAQGWFDAERKRPLPRAPRRVGVVSSLGAAALRDVLTALARRAPHVEVVVYPSLVQGAEAPLQLVQALGRADERQEVDLLLLVRGGGSLEDLWAFNDERVVKAVAQCSLVVVCGVGHETDTTLCDFAADLRAATPTAAAELAVRPLEEEDAALEGLARRLMQSARRRLDRQAQDLDHLALQVLRPSQALAGLQQQWALWAQRWAQAPQRSLQRWSAQWVAMDARLQAQDPRQVLQRGYAWVSQPNGQPITQAQQVRPGQSVVAVWADGEALAQISAVDLGKSQATNVGSGSA